MHPEMQQSKNGPEQDTLPMYYPYPDYYLHPHYYQFLAELPFRQKPDYHPNMPLLKQKG